MELHTRHSGYLPSLFPSSQTHSLSVLAVSALDRCQIGALQVVDQLLPGSGAQHALKDTDGLAALGMGREPEAGADTGSCEKVHSGFADSPGFWTLRPSSPGLM